MNNDNEITIKLKKFDGTESSCDTLYSNSLYDDSFKVRTIYDDIVNVNFGWEQGRGNNYRFYVNDTKYYLPDEITHIEVK
ncbi:Phage protein [Yersinia phage fHe-Yen9-03]|uniref:Phage protein n=1 Tax=Yersinia phage fHe-Yen9-03 TaxID=2052743 RepID=A0A2C9CZN2_9CAUD|nr:Phage protein [Yersinia phage fHe-Yen9-03]